MIYPKDYSCIEIEVELNTAFALMPFIDSFDLVHATINNACLEGGLVCRRVDDIFENKPIVENILNGITKSELIIADLTGRNPNVYYEIGISHSLRDQDSIILITQDIEDVPFDLRHLPILVYDLRNLTDLRVRLKQKMIHCQKVTRKRDSIQKMLLANGISKPIVDGFIYRAEQLSNTKFQTIFSILTKNTINIQKHEIGSLSNYFSHLEEFQSGKYKVPSQTLMLKVYLTDFILDDHKDSAKELLVRSETDMIHVDNSEVFIFRAEYCFGLIRKGKLKEEAINWIVQYLHNYRMGRIDLVRAKIDAFLLSCDDSDIDNAIVEMLSGETVTVRETAADLCGQKKIRKSISKLIKALDIEKNPHVARSCIAALTKLKAKEATNTIFNWMTLNSDKWGEKAVSGSLKNIAIRALEDLDDKDDYLSNFIAFTRQSS